MQKEPSYLGNTGRELFAKIIFSTMQTFEFSTEQKMSFVVYFNKRTGAQHVVCWSKSYFFTQKQFFHLFLSLTEKKRKKGKHKNNTEKLA